MHPPSPPLAMPCVAASPEHRDKMPCGLPSVFALVARPVGKRELAATPKAQEAMQKEWGRLVAEKVWDLSSVQEWDVVARLAREKGQTVQFGHVLGNCVEKNSQLPEGHANRKIKGRVALRGNRVVDQNWEAAVFRDLGSSPAAMEAGRRADCYVCFPGHDVEIADAVQAFIQAKLTTACWVCLPREASPRNAGWERFRRPAVRLDKALHGHPDSGTTWEEHCDKHVKSIGFSPIGEEWPSVCFHDTWKLLLVIYVDDFKLAGPKRSLSLGWKAICRGLKMEPPTPLGMCLVCNQSKRASSGGWFCVNGRV